MSLRSQALRGGAYISIREGLGIALRLSSTLVVTRIIGPTDYGLFAGADAGVTFLALVAQFGMGVYVIRLESEPTAEHYDVLFTAVLFTSVAAALIGLAVSIALTGPVVSASHILPFQVLAIALPINVLWTPAQAKLERGLQFRRMAWVEIGGDLVLAGVSITLAVAGLGVWAPVIGYISWQSSILVFSFVVARYRPRIVFRRAMTLAMLRYGFGFSTANLTYQANELSGPLVVGTLLGPHALGLVALASRIAESLCFVARATWRLSIVVFGRLQTDARRLGSAVSEAMALQAVALAPLLGGFAFFASLLVPAVFGDAWRPSVELLPPVMLGYLLNSVFNMEAALLYVRRESTTMLVTNLLRIAVLFGLAFLFVHRWGTIGWAIAFAIHPIGFVVCARRVDQLLPVTYTAVFWWLVASVPPLFAPYLSWGLRPLLLLPALVICCTPWARGQLREYAQYVRGALRAKSAAAPSV